MDIIQTDKLTRTFPGVTAMDHLTLSVKEGELFGLVGPDGAGKTTTLRLLTTILNPTSGSAWVAGHHTVRDAEAIKKQIGYMSQSFGLYPDLTVLENIRFYADLYSVPRKIREAKMEDLLQFAGLEPFRRRLAGNLSGGMKQKLGLVCTLIHTPRILFLDEPTNGVDPVSRRSFWHILENLIRQKVTVFLSTAYMDEAQRCHRLGLMHGGRLVAVGSPNQVRKMLPLTLLEIRPGRARQATEILRRSMGRQAVMQFGDRIHVITDQPAGTSATIQSLLKQAEIEPGEIKQVRPGLEDVFISMLGGSNREASHDA